MRTRPRVEGLCFPYRDRTDAELSEMASAIREEQEFRARAKARTEDIERRRASIAAGKGDPGPRRRG